MNRCIAWTGVIAPWRRLVIALAAALSLPVGAGAQPAPASVAVVTDLHGAAWRERAPRRDPLALLHVLRAGDVLGLDDGAVVEIAFTSGAGCVTRLEGPGSFRVGPDGIGATGRGHVQVRDLAAVWRALRVQPGAVGRASIALRSLRATDVPLRSPRGAQDGADPGVLRWDPPYGRQGGPWRYAVQVVDSAGRRVLSATTDENALRPDPAIAWVRGAEYLWRVDATGGDGRRATGVAAFHLLDPQLARRLASARDAVVGLRRNAQQADARAEEVLLALAYEDAGWNAAACDQWAALARARPGERTLPTCVPPY